MGTLPDLLGQAVCLILPVWQAKCNNSQASYFHWHGAFEPEIPHRTPQGCLRRRMAQHVHLITPGNTARAILLRPPLVNTGNLQLPYNASK